jgi:hypothetical protein
MVSMASALIVVVRIAVELAFLATGEAVERPAWRERQSP